MNILAMSLAHNKEANEMPYTNINRYMVFYYTVPAFLSISEVTSSLWTMNSLHTDIVLLITGLCRIQKSWKPVILWEAWICFWGWVYCWILHSRSNSRWTPWSQCSCFWPPPQWDNWNIGFSSFTCINWYRMYTFQRMSFLLGALVIYNQSTSS